MTTEVFYAEALTALSNWCVWKKETIRGRQTKVPYDIVTGHKASSTDRTSWRPFSLVHKLMNFEEYNGYGFMVSDGIVFIDIDHCIDEKGTLDKRGADILSAFPLSFAEISQSGKGLHILTQGSIPRNFHNQKQGVEMYSYARFCAITGKAVQAYEPTQEQDGIDYVFNKYSTRTGNSISTYSVPLQTGISTFSDRWVIAHAMNITGQKGRNFRTLFSGDISEYGSQSEADSALCTLLAFWCDRDQGQMDRIFRQSGLYRKKWEREDYRTRTLNHACEHIPESITEYQRRMNREKAKAIAEEQ